MNLANCEPFAKFFANIHRYTENVYGICTDCCLFANFFLANSFYLNDSPEFFPAKYFPCTITVLLKKHILKYNFVNSEKAVRTECKVGTRSCCLI